MSLFEKIKNKRYNLIEAQDQQSKKKNKRSPDYSETSSKTGYMKGNKGYDPATDLIYGDQRDDTGKKKYTKYETDRAKTLKTSPGKLERDVQKGLKGLGGRTSRFPFARKSYKTDAKAILGARQKYKLDPSGNVDMKTTKARLVDRIVRNDPKFNVGSATKFVDELEKSQGPLSKKTGKDSSLYKTVKAEIDARNPTVKSKKSGGRLPLRSKKTGEVVKKKLDKFYQKVADKVDPKFKTPKNLDRTELNLQFKADKLKQDYGGRFAERDGLTAAERKRKLQKLKKDLNIKNPTITSPLTGGQIPATKTNLRKYGFLDGNFKKQNYKKTFTSSGSGSQKSFSTGQSRFKKLTSKLKMPRTQTLRKVGKYALGAYVLNQVLNPGGGGAPIPPPKKEKLTGVKVKDFKFNLAGPGGDGYKPAGMIKK